MVYSNDAVPDGSVTDGQSGHDRSAMPDRMDAAGVETVDDLAGLLRALRRRHARQHRNSELTYRELAARTGWSTAAVAEYLTGRTLPPTDRFDALLRLFGATPREQGALATARDRVAERHRRSGRRDAAGRPPHPAAVPVPRQLPPDVAAFTGRAEHLGRLDDLLAAHRGSSPAPVVISAVSGTAGIGKTALAVHWAHQVADRFPDGQLYLNLRGYDLERPVAPVDALARLLVSLGVAAVDIPVDSQDRAALYRSRLAGRRVLVILDNAATAEQVRPLLPGTGPGMVVVTSRDSLAGLVARDGAYRVVLDPLPLADAMSLLETLIGPRAASDAEAAAALAERCSRLPLALRLAAELAATRPSTPLKTLTEELADRQQRLTRLDAGGDPRAAVTAVFSWSIQHLPTAAARIFRLTGLHPGTDLDEYGVAALADIGLAEARHGLNTLARAHLVGQTSPGRYGMHDLLRAYAAQLAADQDDDHDCQAALDRLLDLYAAVTAAAIDRLGLSDPAQQPRQPPAVTPTPAFPDPAAARGWLDAERPNLVAAVVHAAATGRPTHAVTLAVTLNRYLDGGHFHDALTVHEHARRAAEAAGDLAGQARARFNLGTAHLHLNRFEPAAAALRQAMDLFGRIDDRAEQAHALNTLAKIERRLGNSERAIDHLQRALAVTREVGDSTGEARVLVDLGIVEMQRGRAERAIEHFEPALHLVHRAGNRFGEAGVLVNLGMAEVDLCRYGSAATHLHHALDAFREFGNREGEAWALTNLGQIHRSLNEPERAAELLTTALAIFQGTGNEEGQAFALNGLGDLAHAIGAPAEAVTHHNAALTIAADIGTVYAHARANAGLARAHRALGNLDTARTHLVRALDSYAHLGSSAAETDDINGLLDPARA